ncbi:MAG: NAD-dependent epimerase/dehydratase family protein [Bacteroidales bacterium]|nr:NAD-dependent epimerase/dehydratase family protein [Bacteroidales bacterium]
MVFVTGGTGFLGAHLIYHLLKKGKKVRALKRISSNFDLFNRVFSFYSDTTQELKNSIEWVEGDILDVYLLDEALQDVSVIYHAAAVVSFQPGDKKKMMLSNIEGTANLVNVAIRKNIQSFCHVSSIAAIGRADNEKVIDENTIWKASKRNSNYAVSKYGAEREVWRGMEEGLNAVIVNPSIMLGPGELNSGAGKLISTVLNGLKFYTTGINGYVDVRDVAKVMIELVEKNITCERFILSSENLTYKEIFKQIAINVDKSPPLYKARQWMGEAMWRLEYIKGRIINSKPLITKETAKTARNNYNYSNEKLTKAIDFKFLPVSESIKDACDYYLKVTNS